MEKPPKPSEDKEVLKENEIEEIKEILKNFKREGYRVTLEFFLESHYSRASRKQSELLKEAPIYIPEIFAWTFTHLCIYQAISRGHFTKEDIKLLKEENYLPEDLIKQFQPGKKLNKEDLEKIADWFAKRGANLKPYQYVFEYYLTIFETLLETNKKIKIADIPAGSEIEKKYRENLVKQSPSLKEAIYSSQEITFESILEILKEWLRKNFEILQQDRDRVFVINIPKIISQLLEEDPDLQKKAKKEGIKVLVSLGSMHSRVGEILKDIGFNVEIHHEATPFHIGFQHEVIKKWMSKEEVKEDLLAKALVEKMFEIMIHEIDPGSEWSERFLRLYYEAYSKFAEEIRNLFSKVEIDKVKDLFNKIKNVYKSNHDDETLKEALRKVWDEFIEQQKISRR